MSLITESHAAMIYQHLNRNLYFHWTKKLEELLAANGFKLVEKSSGDFVPDHIVNIISADFWSWRLRYEAPLMADHHFIGEVNNKFDDGVPQLYIREILFALAADGVVPVSNGTTN